MMGTSLLSMPWAILQAGFIGGVVLLVLMALLMFYTSYLVLGSLKLEPGYLFLCYPTAAYPVSLVYLLYFD